jgi:hypothetical protein
MNYVAVKCADDTKARGVIDAMLGEVVFVDVEGVGFPGCAIGDVKVFCCGIGDGRAFCEPWIDLSVASFESAVKGIRRHCGLEKAARGLGDWVAKLTGFFGINPCGGCEKRQEKLNRLVPFNG